MADYPEPPGCKGKAVNERLSDIAIGAQKEPSLRTSSGDHVTGARYDLSWHRHRNPPRWTSKTQLVYRGFSQSVAQKLNYSCEEEKKTIRSTRCRHRRFGAPGYAIIPSTEAELKDGDRAVVFLRSAGNYYTIVNGCDGYLKEDGGIRGTQVSAEEFVNQLALELR